jgi:mono/diheme cytochrome c family protein
MPPDDYPAYDNAVRGRYLSTQVGACIECHTPHETGPDVLDPQKYFSGGETFPLGLPADPVSANLTSDRATGLGDWEVEDIVRAIKEGVDVDDRGVCPPMPVGPTGAYGDITDEDARDIAHYLKSLPPIKNEVVDECTWPPM